MSYREADYQLFKMSTKNNPRPVEVLGFLSDNKVRARCFTDVKFDHLNLDVVATWEDTSFAHAFGTHRDGFYDVFEIFYNDTMLPIALISDETVQKLLDLINKPEGRT